MVGKIIDEVLTVEEYLNRKANNESDSYIVAELFTSPQSLRNWKLSKGITNKDVNQYKYKIIKNLRNKGFTVDNIAIQMNLHRKTVQNIYKQFGMTKEVSNC